MDNTANTSPSSTAKFSVLHWLDENFEKIFLVIGLLAIILFITLQTVYRYVITYIFLPTDFYHFRSSDDIHERK